MLNLEEIKKRAEGLKKETPIDGTHDVAAMTVDDFVWAADTILQLVAEVERREKNFKYFYNKGLKKLKQQLPDTPDNFKEIQALMTAHEVCVENEKLAAANKIMRDEVDFAIKYLESTGIQNLQFRDEPEHQMLKGLKKSLAEADEFMK